MRTADLVKAKVDEIAPRLPAGYNYAYANDTTDFIKLSIEEVVKTLLEAIVLVVLVMFVFLQSWRATLIPAIAVPVVLLGTFAVLYALGFSINTMTLFGLVLAVGLLVDDAIVVVENVERLLDENPEMTPREATIKSMGQIQMALVAIALVLSAVFLPMVFFGGSTGVIYRQFSVTIVSAMVLSVFVALILSPAIAANLLRRNHATRRGNLARPNGAAAVAHRDRGARVKFNDGFDRLRRLVRRHGRPGDRPQMAVPRRSMPASSLLLDPAVLPASDRLPADRGPGRGAVQFRLPAGATLTRTLEVQRAGREIFPERAREEERPDLFHRRRRRQGAARPEHRPGLHQPRRSTSARAETTAPTRSSQRASSAFRGLRDAQVFALVPGAIRGLGQSSGFTMELQNTQRHEPRGVRRGARPAARRGQRRPQAGLGPPQRLARRRHPEGRHRPAAN